LPAKIPRIALVDFNNDCVRDSLEVCQAMFAEYRRCIEEGNLEEAEKYKLYGVRLDTANSIRDVSLPPLGDPNLDLGVNPRLVFVVRQALDKAWQDWNLCVSGLISQSNIARK
jgi:nicotinate phosphoribosyltransferase